MANETRVTAALIMDRSDPIGNTPPPGDPEGRRRLSVWVGNTLAEPIPVTVTAASESATNNVYNSVPVVVSGVDTLIVSYTIPVGFKGNLLLIEYSGENIARYQVSLNSVVMATRRTYYGSSLSDHFFFATGSGGGLPLVAGDNVSLRVLQVKPSSAAFEGRILFNQVPV
jgi:hypothetical protein